MATRSAAADGPDLPPVESAPDTDDYPLFPATAAAKDAPLFPPAPVPRRPDPGAAAPGAGSSTPTPLPRRVVLTSDSLGDPSPDPPGPAPGSPPPGRMPPPVAPVRGAPTAQPAASANSGAAGSAAVPRRTGTGYSTVVGFVDGPVSLDTQEYRPRGVRVFVAAALLVAVYLGVRLTSAVLEAVARKDSLSPGLRRITYAAAVAGFLVLLVVAALRAADGKKRRPDEPGLLPTAFKAVANTFGRLLLLVLRLLGNGLATAFRQDSSAVRLTGDPHLTRSVRRFRVRQISGQVTACILAGEPVGDEVRQGDAVRVHGRRLRHGHLEARQVEVLTDLLGPAISTVVTRTTLGCQLASWIDRAAWLLALAGFGFLGYHLLGMLA